MPAPRPGPHNPAGDAHCRQPIRQAGRHRLCDRRMLRVSDTSCREGYPAPLLQQHRMSDRFTGMAAVTGTASRLRGACRIGEERVLFTVVRQGRPGRISSFARDRR